MNDEFSRLVEAASALVTYIDTEQVFDKAADLGCGGFDTYQSETFCDLVANLKKVLAECETTLKKSS